MGEGLIGKADDGDFGNLFRVDLYWHGPDHEPIEVELEDGTHVTATNVSSFKGVRVWEVPTAPDSAVEAALDRAIAKASTNRLVIFHDGDTQVWRWPSRSSKGAGVTSRPARHVHKIGSDDPQFEAKLDAIRLPNDVVLDVNDLLTRVRSAFDVETKNETKRASKLMAQMYAAVEKGYAPNSDPQRRDHEISVTLARVLFLLFGDDTEMWKDGKGDPLPDLVQNFVKDRTKRDGSDISEQFNALFKLLNTRSNERTSLDDGLEAFPYVNGGIFEEAIALPTLDQDFRDAVLAASAVDWSTISPAIFGSMFQSVRDAQTRRELGEHYTSEENILKTLNPLFLDELRAEFDSALARETSQKRINALNGLWKKLGDIRYMDPACGCGNFIIVAYRELRDLELSIMDALANLQLGEGAVTLETDWTHLLKVSLDHFYGIEIDEWPARIAETAMFLIDRQCDLKMKERFGVAPERLPIRKAATIVVGNALRVDWREVCPRTENVIIAGNPPFLGHATRSPEQAQELRDAWGKDDISRLDYVTGWHAKAMAYFRGQRGLWAFVTTNSITQGDPVPHLFGPIFEEGWDIKFAHRTFPWTSEATGKAAVHCVIVGFAQTVGRPLLFDFHAWGAEPHRAKAINGYLVDGPRVFVTKRSSPLAPGLPEAVFGAMPRDGGNLVVEPNELAEVEADAIAKQFVRPYVGSEELIRGKQRWCLWLTSATPTQLKQSPVLSERISAVKAFRLESSAGSTVKMAQTPHLFGQRPPEHEVPYVCIPRVFSERRRWLTVARLPASVISSDATFTATDHDGFLFALISSSMFMAWQRAVGGRLKSDLRFSNTIVWNNFPLPELDPSQRSAIVAAATRVLDARTELGNKPLSELYQPDRVPPALEAAHLSLDEFVDEAFGLSASDNSEEARQAALFEAYARVATGNLAGLSATRGRRQ